MHNYASGLYYPCSTILCNPSKVVAGNARTVSWQGAIGQTRIVGQLSAE